MIKNIAVIIPSYKRLVEVRQQIYSTLNQSFPVKKIFVAAKGFPEDIVEKYLQKPFEDDLSVKIKCCSNKGQLSNVLDCVRGEDLSDIDYFIKMDDDDIYGKDYIKNIVSFLNKNEGNNIHGVGTNIASIMSKKNTDIYIYRDYRPFFFGGAMAYSPEVIKFLFRVEGGDEEALEKVSEFSEYNNYMEDKFTQVVCEKIFGGFKLRDENDEYLYNSTNVSCCRNPEKYASEVGDRYMNLFDANKRREETFLHIMHESWGDVFRIFGKRVNRVSEPEEKGNLVLFDGETLIVKWDKWGEECFKKVKGKFFVLVKKEE